MTDKQRLTFARILALLVVIFLSLFIYSIRDQVKELAQYGYLGIFLLSILANATVLLPAPGILFVFTMGAIYNPIGVAVAAGLGAAIGELTGYLAGFSGQAVVERVEYYETLLKWMEEHKNLSSFAILFLAFIPNPLFDLAGIASGTLKIPIPRFLFFVSIGKILKMLLVAYAGASTLNSLFNY
jgi:membrane protein YqaA with SNARE-associated domain